MRKPIFAAILLLACGNDGAIRADVSNANAGVTKSGSRIKTRVMAAGDGSKVLLGLRDTQLEVDCLYLRTTGGKFRCGPTVPDAVFAGEEYGDEACTVPVASVPAGCREPRWVIRTTQPSASSCVDGDVAYFGDVKPYEGSALFARDDAGACVRRVLAPGGRYVVAGSDVTTIFQEGSEMIE